MPLGKLGMLCVLRVGVGTLANASSKKGSTGALEADPGAGPGKASMATGS